MKLPKFTYLLAAAITTVTTLAVSATASAHVVVKPAETGTASFQTFTTGVPNEKEIEVTGLRLVIPDNLNYVTPNVKPGWEVTTTKTGEGDDAKVSEITWSGGAIPAGQRDEFLFSAQTPDKPTTIAWKAYQTYADGSVAAWENAPNEGDHDEEDEAKLPYSQTKVVTDPAADSAASATAKTAQDSAAAADKRATLALVLSGVAVVLTFVTLSRVIALRKA